MEPNIFGGQGGTRTHKILILSQTRMPIPSPGHIMGEVRLGLVTEEQLPRLFDTRLNRL